MPVDGSCLLLQLRQVVGVVGQVGEHHPLLVVVLAQDLVVAEEKPVADTKSGNGNEELLIRCYAAFGQVSKNQFRPIAQTLISI